MDHFCCSSLWCLHLSAVEVSVIDHRQVRRCKPRALLKPLVHALKAGPTGEAPHPVMDQDSHPASREFKSCVLVEAFLGRGHVDVDGFLEQQLPGIPGHVRTYVSHGMSLQANNSCTDTAHLCTISHPRVHALSIGMLSIYSITLLVMHRLLSAHQVLQWLLGLIITECQ